MDERGSRLRGDEPRRGRQAPPADPVGVIALLAEPVRRRIYEWVAAAGRPVARDEVAAALTIGRPLAAFHLDRLAAAGLLDVEYRRRTGRSGPGAGRPAKFYRRAGVEIVASVPERHYDRIAEFLAAAVEASASVVPPPELTTVARRAGRALGEAARDGDAGAGAEGAAGPGRRGGAVASATDRLRAVLAANGYEPALGSDGTVTLRNCPFDSLVARHRTLVCGTNVAFAEGLLEGLGETEIAARLEPGPGRCCVVFAPAAFETRRGAP
ncbi:MAG TPA: helix-turn-helix domain-containing protein [Candidatus Binatia bacterium]|nr:helix-turn-helix domain-containing protein [Candidatus Binatia bacterium]